MSQRILIIDDDVDIRRIMRRMLEPAGYEVGEAADGPQGLAAFGDGAIWDLVLLDQRIPGMDGLEILRRIEARAPTARVIMVTAFASIDLAVEAMKLGATDFMRKSMIPEMLSNTVAAALAKVSGGVRGALSTESGLAALTMNGFQIERAFHENGETPDKPGTYSFIVRSLTEGQRTVVVEVRPEAVTMVEKVTSQPFPLANTFWASYAERRLATYLWDEGHMPSSGLTITRVALEDVHTTARYEQRI